MAGDEARIGAFEALAASVSSQFQSAAARLLVELRTHLDEELEEAFAALGIGLSSQLEEALRACSTRSALFEMQKATSEGTASDAQSAWDRDDGSSSMTLSIPPQVVVKAQEEGPALPGQLADTSRPPSPAVTEQERSISQIWGLMNSQDSLRRASQMTSRSSIGDLGERLARHLREAVPDRRKSTMEEPPRNNFLRTARTSVISNVTHRSSVSSFAELEYDLETLQGSDKDGLLRRRTVQWKESVMKAEEEAATRKRQTRQSYQGRRLGADHAPVQSVAEDSMRPVLSSGLVQDVPLLLTAPAPRSSQRYSELWRGPLITAQPDTELVGISGRPALASTVPCLQQRKHGVHPKRPQQELQRLQLQEQLVQQQQRQLKRVSPTTWNSAPVSPTTWSSAPAVPAVPVSSSFTGGRTFNGKRLSLVNFPPLVAQAVASDISGSFSSVWNAGGSVVSGTPTPDLMQVQVPEGKTQPPPVRENVLKRGGRLSAMISPAACDIEEEPRLEPLMVWRESRRRTASVNTLRVMAYESIDDEAIEARGVYESRVLTFLQACVVDPNGRLRLTWDLLGFIFISTDMIMMPLGMFQPAETNFSRNASWVMRAYWTCDMPSQFLTGFQLSDGDTEMNLLAIARHYCMRWMVLDVSVIIVDWLDVFVMRFAGVNAARVGKVMRIVRLLRVLRMLRLGKLPMISGTWLECYVKSERVMVVGGMLRTLVLIVAVTHFIACCWWGIGTMDGPQDSWVEKASIIDDGFAYQYTTSFHWALAQFMGGSDVWPTNVWERTYAIVVLLFSFTVSAIFVSSITSAMTRLQMILGNKTAMFSELRQYMTDNQIPAALAARVSRNAHRAYMDYQRTTPEAEIELLKLVSEPLRVELHFEVHSPVLTTNPFFHRYNLANPAALRRVCHSAINVVFLSVGDVLFVNGEAPRVPQMWFVLNGALSYRQDGEPPKAIGPAVPHRFSVTTESGRRSSLTGMEQAKGRWVSEAVLWCPWIHCGVLRAETDCRLLGVHALIFQEIVPQFSSGDCRAASYATEYVKRLNEQMRNGRLTDLDETGISAEVTQDVFDRRASTQAGKVSLWRTLQRSASRVFRASEAEGSEMEERDIGDVAWTCDTVDRFQHDGRCDSAADLSDFTDAQQTRSTEMLA